MNWSFRPAALGATFANRLNKPGGRPLADQTGSGCGIVGSGVLSRRHKKGGHTHARLRRHKMRIGRYGTPTPVAPRLVARRTVVAAGAGIGVSFLIRIRAN
jgi:hypothetical protein